MLEEADDGDLFEDVDSAVVAECLDEFKNFYTSRYMCACACVFFFVSRSDGGRGGSRWKVLLTSVLLQPAHPVDTVLLHFV